MWTTEVLESLSHLLGAISWGIALLLLLLTPGLIGLVVRSYRHSRTEQIASYISKHIPLPLFRGGVYLLHLLTFGSIALQLAIRYGLYTDSDTDLIAQYGLWGLGIFFALGLFYRLTYSVWSVLYMEQAPSMYLKQDYLVLTTLRSGLLLILSLLILTPIPTSTYLVVFGVSLGILQLLRSIQTIRRLSQGKGTKFYIFLYLCAHELLPWLCVAQLVVHWTNG